MEFEGGQLAYVFWDRIHSAKLKREWYTLGLFLKDEREIFEISQQQLSSKRCWDSECNINICHEASFEKLLGLNRKNRKSFLIHAEQLMSEAQVNYIFTKPSLQHLHK